jgi:isochorismate synthase
MKLVDGKARIYVGGGITKDSNAGEEWMETVNKSQIMKSVLVK